MISSRGKKPSWETVQLNDVFSSSVLIFCIPSHALRLPQCLETYLTCNSLCLETSLAPRLLLDIDLRTARCTWTIDLPAVAVQSHFSRFDHCGIIGNRDHMITPITSHRKYPPVGPLCPYRVGQPPSTCRHVQLSHSKPELARCCCSYFEQCPCR
jgi:hypothetical protein